MAELIVVMMVGAVVLAVFGLMGAVLSLLGWVIALPFKLLALTFKGLAAILAVPFMLLFGLIGFVLFGAGILVFLIPAVPFILIALLVVALLRGRDKPPAQGEVHTAG